MTDLEDPEQHPLVEFGHQEFIDNCEQNLQPEEPEALEAQQILSQNDYQPENFDHGNLTYDEPKGLSQLIVVKDEEVHIHEEVQLVATENPDISNQQQPEEASVLPQSDI